MARPKKIGLDYFPVDVSWDQKMQAFDLLCKNDGITFIIYFWQAAYQTESGEVDLSGLFGELMANKCRITTEQLEKILQTAKKIDLLYQTETGSWTSNGIKKRISSVSKERSDAILRQEESKEKKSKEKKSKVKETPHYSENNHSCSSNNSNISKKRTWRSSWWEYLRLTLLAFREITGDADEMQTLEKLHPNMDISLSLQKSIHEYWGTKEGWKNKKSRKSCEINMAQTLIKNLDKSRVYKPREETQRDSVREAIDAMEARGEL